jgi:outer membrane protein TolC
MKRKFMIISMMLLPCLSELNAQKILTLGECYSGAAASNALVDEKSAYSNIWQLKDQNLLKGWLPSLDANGSFIYNSSVIDLSSTLGSLPIPGIASAIKPLPNEQYKITLDINQAIYDGGAIKNARALGKAELNVNEKQTETDLYKLRAQVNTYYFNLLLLGRQKEILETYLDLIDKRISSMQSALSNGVILKSDIDVMTSEQIRIEQQIKENEITKKSFMVLLSDITGIVVDTSSRLVIPSLTGMLMPELSRPELQLFDLHKKQLDADLKILESNRLPKAFGFATFGYGNPPGNNFFKDEFAPYYVVGAAVRWNIFDWNKTKNEKQVITLQQGILENRKSDLTDNLNRLLEAKKAEITNLKSMVETDTELIAIRKRITASAESQYENGTITATELLNEMNSERLATLNYEIHKINLSMAQIEYLNISGKEIE